ncbi:MAG: hypothetical protein WD248_02550 [Actinomycetota bacterium]
MDRPSPDEVRRAGKALFLGIALGFVLLFVDRTRSSSAPDRRPEP